jgi:hypothetical protein
MDVTMSDRCQSALEVLPDELLQEIFARFQPRQWRPSFEENTLPYGPDEDDRPKEASLGALCRRTKRFYHIAMPLFYADVNFTTSGPAAIRQMTGLFKTLAAHPKLSKRIERISNPNIMGMRVEVVEEEDLAIQEALNFQLTIVRSL